MADRYAKKARTLFDPKEKEKHRVAALESLVELMESEEEKRVFFRDNIEYLCQLALDTFQIAAEKIDTQRDYRERFEKAMGKESFAEVFHFPVLLEWIIEYGGQRLYEQPTLAGLQECVRRLVTPTSHPLLRREGMRLVLYWMKRKMTDDVRLVFSTAVELRQFNADPTLNLGQPDYPVCGRPLVEAPLSKQNQAEAMFEDILGLITYDPDANRASLGLLWKELQRAYLSVLYPSVFAEYKMVRLADSGFVREAPPRLQSILIKYVLLWLQRDPSQPQVDRLPVACFLIEEMLLSSPIESEIVHEVLRQGLLLPWEYAPTVRAVIALLRWWVFQPASRRPPFLREDLHGLLPSDGNVEAGLMEVYTERYIRRIQSLYDGRPSFGVEAGQAEVYRDGLAFLRATAMGHYWRPTAKVWGALINALLCIAQSHLAVAPKQEPIAVPEHGLAFASQLTETLLGAYVRSGTHDAAQWERLASVLAKSTRWRPVLVEWARALASLTALLVSTVVLEESTVAAAAAAGTYARIASAESVTADLLAGPDLPPPRHESFLTWSHQLVATSGLPFLWRNWLRAIGSPASVEAPENVELVVKSLVAIWNQLRPYAKLMTYQMDLTEALFDTFESCTGKPYEASRCAIAVCLSRQFLADDGQALTYHSPARFFLALVQGVADKDARLAGVVLRATSHVFSQGRLPGPSVLVPSLLRCLGAALNGPLPYKDTLVSMLRLVASVAVLPDTYARMPVPRIEAPLSSMAGTLPVAHAGDIALDDSVRHQAPCLLSLALDRLLENRDAVEQPSARHKAPKGRRHQPSELSSVTHMGTTTTLMLNELYQLQPDRQLVDQYLSLLLSALDTAKASSAGTDATMCVLASSAFASHPVVDADRQGFVAQSLLSILHGRDELDVALLRGLWAWIMALPEAFLVSNGPVGRQILNLLLSSSEQSSSLFLSHLLHQLGNYPEAPSAIPDRPDVALCLGTDSLLTLKQCDGSVNVSAYNATGQRCWSFTPLVDEADPVLPDSLRLNSAIPMARLEPYLPAVPIPAPLTSGQLPLYGKGVSLEQTDMLAALLSHLDAEFPESREAASGPEYVSPERRDAVAEMRAACEALVKVESETAQQCLKDVAELDNKDRATRLSHRRARPKRSDRAPSRFHQGRTLLSHLGLLTAPVQKDLHPGRFPVGLLSHTKALRRELDHLAQLPSSSQHKVALLFAGVEAANEASLLAAGRETSAAYRAFAHALGSYSALSGLPFAGGLSPTDTTDGKALVYACPTHALLFHEPAHFAESDDPLAVKRHVGNDAVHIVWNESGRPYDPSTIKSDYGNLQIVITPRPTDSLYSISLHADARYVPDHLATGPLFDGALLPCALLAPLVRATAVAADRILSASHDNVPAPLSPSADRAQAIKQIVERQLLVSWAPAQVMAYIAAPPESLGEQPAMTSPVVI